MATLEGFCQEGAIVLCSLLVLASLSLLKNMNHRAVLVKCRMAPSRSRTNSAKR